MEYAIGIFLLFLLVAFVVAVYALIFRGVKLVFFYGAAAADANRKQRDEEKARRAEATREAEDVRVEMVDEGEYELPEGTEEIG